MRQGFTILEVLAATMVLGLLAVAVIPLTRTLVSDHDRLEQVMQARAWLMTTAQPLAMYAKSTHNSMPISERPGWFIHIHILPPTMPPPARGATVTLPSYHWVRLDVANQSLPGQGVLASRLLIIPGAP